MEGKYNEHHALERKFQELSSKTFKEKGRRDLLDRRFLEIHPHILNYVRCWPSLKHDAEDITHEVYIACCESVHKLKSWDSFSPWVFAITRVMMLKWYFKNCIPLPTDELAEFVSVEDKIILSEETRLISEWLKNKANKKERIIILAHYFDNISYRIIADKILHENRNAVKAIGWRALPKIRQYIINAICSKKGE